MTCEEEKDEQGSGRRVGRRHLWMSDKRSSSQQKIVTGEIQKMYWSRFGWVAG